MLKAEGKITDVIIENMMNWRHSGFNVYCGKAIWPHNEEGLENLARCIIRASFSQERMTYIAAGESANGVAKVIYGSVESLRRRKSASENNEDRFLVFFRLDDELPLVGDGS